jgi:hypothetical protein
MALVAKIVDGLSRERQLLSLVEPKESGSFISALSFAGFHFQIRKRIKDV